MFDKETTDKMLKAALMSAMGDGVIDRMISEIFGKILHTKVNKYGQQGYTHDGGSPDTPYIDYLLKREFTRVIEEAVTEMVNQRADEIKQKVQNTLLTVDGSLAENLVSKIVSKLWSQDIRLNVKFDVEANDANNS